ncbi:MAG: DPP IV N-terminal domain-containing protein, partial [Draconibacterium sp.]|nr:DPP IV N-terminal domain-containing protein [Draconibacterium sp.]
MKHTLSLTAVFLFGFFNLLGQDTICLDDYNRAVQYQYENYNNKTVFNLYIQPHWFPDSTGMWYTHHSNQNKKYLKISVPDLVQTDLFDHKKLAQLLSDSLNTEIQPEDLPINTIEYISAKKLKIRAKNKAFILNTETYELSKPSADKKKDEKQTESPDKKWTAYSKDYNLFIKSNTTNDITQLSFSGKKGYEYATWYGWADVMEGENGERPHHFSVTWSEDSKWISTSICDLRMAKKMYLLDWSIDTLYRPKLLSYYRGSPGDTDMVYMEPVFFNIETGKEVKPDLPRSTHINSIKVLSTNTPEKVILEQTSRGYQKVKLFTFNLITEELQNIYTETSETNLDNFTSLLAKEDDILFFLSEKSGWNQLYSLDLKTNKETA